MVECLPGMHEVLDLKNKQKKDTAVKIFHFAETGVHSIKNKTQKETHSHSCLESHDSIAKFLDPKI